MIRREWVGLAAAYGAGVLLAAQSRSTGNWGTGWVTASRPLTVSVVAGTGLALLAVLVASRR